MPGVLRRAGYLVAAAACLWPAVDAPLALAVGVAFALALGNPFAATTSRWSGTLLKVAVVGLGFGVPLGRVVDTGVTGLWVTGLGVMLMLVAGLLLGRAMRVGPDTRTLISSGTAICGGSAIAAVAPVIGARAEAISVSLAVVFVLNAVALYLFPLVGGALDLSQSAFAWWAAIAIHDTSSVVGAASVYGPEALEQATVLKLARALWIVPLALGLAAWLHAGRAHSDDSDDSDDRDERSSRVRVPWFIALFVLAAGARSLLPDGAPAFDAVAGGARQLMVLVLFLIGSGLSLAAMRAIGWRPLAHAAVLWVIVSGLSLAVVLAGVAGLG